MSNAERDNIRLYLQLQKSRLPYEQDHEHNWYVIRDDDDNSDKWVMSPIPSMSKKFPRDSISACLGSTIFVCGGRRFLTDKDWNYEGNWKSENPMSTDFWFVETNAHDHEDDNAGSINWTIGPSMLLRRAAGNACAVALDQELYVFGGVHQLPFSGPCPWAECYHIKDRVWSPLEPPLAVRTMPEVSACLPFNLDDGTGSWKQPVILVYFHVFGYLHAFRLETKKWRKFDYNFGKKWENLHLVSGTNFLLATKNLILYGYHVRRKKWFQDPVKVLDGKQVLPTKDMVQDDHHPFHLVSLDSNGKLCVLWLNRNNNFSALQISCMKFAVREEESTLVAEVKSTQVFNLPYADALICCLQMAPLSTLNSNEEEQEWGMEIENLKARLQGLKSYEEQEWDNEWT